MGSPGLRGGGQCHRDRAAAWVDRARGVARGPCGRAGHAVGVTLAGWGAITVRKVSVRDGAHGSIPILHKIAPQPPDLGTTAHADRRIDQAVGCLPQPTVSRRAGEKRGTVVDVRDGYPRDRTGVKIMARTSTPKTSAHTNIIQLKVTLRGVRPPVWRRLLMPGTMTLSQLHTAIQAVMGWHDCHLHVFNIGGEPFGDRRSVDDVAD